MSAIANKLQHTRTWIVEYESVKMNHFSWQNRQGWAFSRLKSHVNKPSQRGMLEVRVQLWTTPRAIIRVQLGINQYSNV